MRNPPRRRPLHNVVLSALLLTVSLSGCTASSTPPVKAAPVETATATATATATEAPPIFASNDEALTAATATYAAYLTAGDVAGKIGSESWNEYLSMTTGAEHEDVVASRTTTENEGRSFTGTTSFDSMTIQMSSALPDATWEIRTYVCLDISKSHMVDATGRSVSTPDRQVRWPMVVAFIAHLDSPSQLLISESRLWSGSNFC